jgi:hypothetical protein
MTASLNDAIMAVTETFSKIRADLYVADVHAISASSPVRESSAKTKAWAYVWMAAATEQYVKEVIQAVLAEINAQAVPQANLKKCLFSLVLASDLDSLKTANKAKSWRQRSALFNATGLTRTVAFNLDVRPLDGRTITADHFECIWEVFGFTPPHVPHPKHKLAMKELAENRNKVAHGHVDPITFGRSKTVTDLTRLSDHVEEVLLHLWDRAEDYLTNRLYLA